MGFVKPRLGMMMFLQYAVWGIWLPLLGVWLQKPVAEGGLGFEAGQVGWIAGLAGSVGAISAPFIAGQLADRLFSTERFLGALLIIGGVINYIISEQTSYTAWLVLSILYSVVYMPTISLSNSMAFAHLKNPDTEFARVRVFGTFGWIAVGWLFPMIWLQTNLQASALPPFLVGEPVVDATARMGDALKVSGVISIIYGFFCFTLPNTPPKKDATESLAFAKAFQMVKNRSVLILVLASIPISIIHNIYFQQGGFFLESVMGIDGSRIMPALTVGQIAEILVMAGLGFVIASIGIRGTIIVGGAAYALRYLIWGMVAGAEPSSAATTIAVISQGLHGVCFACFFAASFIYIDRMASDDIRNSAQTVFGIVILGIGPVFSGPFSGFLASTFGEDGVITNFRGTWLTLAGIALATTVMLAMLFRDESPSEEVEG